jgi:hypothetical protein
MKKTYKNNVDVFVVIFLLISLFISSLVLAAPLEYLAESRLNNKSVKLQPLFIKLSDDTLRQTHQCIG